MFLQPRQTPAKEDIYVLGNPIKSLKIIKNKLVTGARIFSDGMSILRIHICSSPEEASMLANI
jgi:hypothetical protein